MLRDPYPVCLQQAPPGCPSSNKFDRHATKPFKRNGCPLLPAEPISLSRQKLANERLTSPAMFVPCLQSSHARGSNSAFASLISSSSCYNLSKYICLYQSRHTIEPVKQLTRLHLYMDRRASPRPVIRPYKARRTLWPSSRLVNWGRSRCPSKPSDRLHLDRQAPRWIANAEDMKRCLYNIVGIK